MAFRPLLRFFKQRRYAAPSARAMETLPDSTRKYLRAMPKAEIHLHFEGAVFPETIHALARKYNVDSIRTRADADWLLYFQNPRDFFQKFLQVSALFRQPEDFYLASIDLGRRLHEQNIRYVELTLAPHKFMRAGIPYNEILSAIDAGLQQAPGSEKRRHAYIIDIVRDLGPELGMETVRAIEAHPNPRVAGIGLGGGERFPSEDSRTVFEAAAALGLRKTVHAGEQLGPDSIWSALKSLSPERLDHGVRAIEDDSLVEHLVQNRIPLNVCPTSNVMLGVYPSLEKHPIRELDRCGVPVNIGTDDPAFFRVDLSEEFAKLLVYCGYQLNEIPSLSQNALRASFLDEESKTRMMGEFTAESRRLADLLSIPGMG